ncbi:MAG: DNA internalization-related competence protein ComEC/Rec2 [Bacillota bacterium]
MVHILSVSGYHVGVVTVILLTLLRFLRVPVRFNAWVVIPMLIFYALMTGLGPAVFRSTIMAVLLLLAYHLGRQQDWPTTLAVAAGIILVFNPLDLYDIGFQLSFAATWGLLYLTPRLTNFFPKIPRDLSLLITIPLAAQLATLPLVVLYFNLVSPVSVLANLLTSHLVALIMLFGGMALGVGVIFLPLAGFINTGTGLLTDLFLRLVQFSGALPGAAWYVPAPPLWLVLIYYLLLVGVFELLQRPRWQALLKQFLRSAVVKGHRNKIILSCMIFLLLTCTWLAWPVDNRLELHFIDVGQGDSALIITPNGGRVLVDAGGWRDELLTGRGAGEQAVVPYLHRLGINHLEALIITHPHTDHAGGVRAVIRAMPVEMVVVSPYGLAGEDQVDEGYDSLLKEIRDRDIPAHPASAGDQLKVDPALTLQFLSPQEKYAGTRSDANNNSLVMLLDYQGRTALFTGDIETETEEALMQEGRLPEAEVLKVPHHGSGYFQPDFFSQISPDIAVISVGANNRFGHPSPKTLEALRQINSKIYRTDRQGAVILTTDGVNWKIKTGK